MIKSFKAFPLPWDAELYPNQVFLFPLHFLQLSPALHAMLVSYCVEHAMRVLSFEPSLRLLPVCKHLPHSPYYTLHFFLTLLLFQILIPTSFPTSRRDAPYTLRLLHVIILIDSQSVFSDRCKVPVDRDGSSLLMVMSSAHHRVAGKDQVFNTFVECKKR